MATLNGEAVTGHRLYVLVSQKFICLFIPSMLGADLINIDTYHIFNRKLSCIVSLSQLSTEKILI